MGGELCQAGEGVKSCQGRMGDHREYAGAPKYTRESQVGYDVRRYHGRKEERVGTAQKNLECGATTSQRE